MFRLLCLICVSLLTLTSAPSRAEIAIAAVDIPGLLQRDQQGAYDRVLARLSDMTGLRWQISYLPAARANKTLSNGSGCAIPYDLRHFNGISEAEKAVLVSSEPLNIARAYLFTRPGAPILNTIPDDPGFRLGARRGMPYGKEFDQMLARHPERIEFVDSDDSNAQKLLANRIDGMLAYFPDMSAYYNAHPNRPVLNFNRAKPLITHRDSLVCPATPPYQAFMTQFNAALAKLKASGELEEILDLYYVKP